MGRLIALTAKSGNGDNYTVPRVVYVNDDAIKVTGATKTGKGTKVSESIQKEANTYVVYEKGIQIEAARNPLTTDVYTKNHISLAVAGAGTTQAAGTVLSRYLTEALTIGAGATEAFTLPAAVVGMVRVVINNDVAGDPAKVFPFLGDFHKGQAVNTVYSIPANTRKHFVCLATGIWTVAEDYA